MIDFSVISVVGGGWSFREVDHEKVPGYVIAINDSAFRLRCPVDAIVSMDRLWVEHRWRDIVDVSKPSWFRRSALQNIKDWSSYPWLTRFENLDLPIGGHATFSGETTQLNGNNSGVCGLNLAWSMVPKRCYMFGFDMCRSPSGEAYWYPPYPWTSRNGNTKPGKYQKWATEFVTIRNLFHSRGIELINVSAHTQIRSITHVSPKKLGMAA